MSFRSEGNRAGQCIAPAAGTALRECVYADLRVCGIAGIFRTTTPRGAAPDDRLAVGAMLAAMRHRGPDGEGRFAQGPLAMGMVRLSIIDPAGGRQPLSNEDGSIVVIANGEIYNFVELRALLAGRGHVLATGSDCEVIAHLYEEHGEGCVDFLRGMFAFALWDARKGRLLLARDRLGEKPLYLHEAGGVLTFASELRALLAAGLAPFALDHAAVNDFFHYSYPIDPQTTIRNVRKLPAGCTLSVEIGPDGRLAARERAYWDILDAQPLEADPADALGARLEEVGSLLVRSDVPVGVALSGGLDSSLVAALASRASGGALRAFCVGYAGRPECDERERARALASHLNIPFESVEIDERAMLDDFEAMVAGRDDPIADIAGYGYYAVARAARRAGVPVLLMGHGGDELFWGYPWVLEALRLNEGREIPPPPPPPAGGGLRTLVRSLVRRPRSRTRTPAHSSRTNPGGPLIFYDITPDFSRVASMHEQLYTPAFLREVENLPPHRWFARGERDRPDLAMTRLIVDIYMRENGLAQADRLSMASSVECRLPLIDHRLVETVIGLRKARRDDDCPPKHWLRETARRYLPPWVLDRPKMGFSPPTHLWVRALAERFGHLLKNGVLVEQGVVRARAVEELVRGGVRPGEIMPLVFKAIVLEVWARRLQGR